MSISPYSGHTFHESPIFLHFYRFLLTNAKELIPNVFILVDITTALILSAVSYNQLNNLIELEEQRITKNTKKDDIKRLSIDRNQIQELSLKVAVIYLLSPYSLLSCVGQSTSVFTNFLMALSLLTTTLRMRLISTALAALLSYQCFYPSLMIVAIAMIIEQKTQQKTKNAIQTQEVKYSEPLVRFSMLSTLALFVMFWFALLFVSYRLMGDNYEFLYSTYGFL